MKKIILYLLITFTLLISGCSDSLAPIVQPNELKSGVNNAITTPSLPAEDNITNNETNPVSNEVAEIELEPTNESISSDEYDYTLQFPSDKYPETALHIYSAIENGASNICTIDREGADENRKQSLKGIETKKGYDRDEWPMAMCSEGGENASVAYIDSSDNRGAGSWVGHQLSSYENGKRVLFIVEKPKNLFGNKQVEATPVKEDTDAATEVKIEEQVIYKNCTEVREAGAAPLLLGEPGYSKKLDRDGDGVACEV